MKHAKTDPSGLRCRLRGRFSLCLALLWLAATPVSWGDPLLVEPAETSPNLESPVHPPFPAPPSASTAPRAVKPDYQNCWYLDQVPGPPEPAPVGTTFFSGGAWSFEDPSTVPDTVPHTPPNDDDATTYLAHASFGQTFAFGYAGFVEDARAEANRLLYSTEDVDQAAFRYKQLIYGVDNCDPDTDPGCVPEDVVNLIQARVKSMSDFYGEEQRQSLQTAEAWLRSAVNYAPLRRDVRWDLLDLYYDRAVAEMTLAKERLVEATQLRLEPPPEGGFVIDNEIAMLEQTLGADDQLGGLRYAASGYFGMLSDRMGIDTASVDPSAPGNPPFGYYVFQREMPLRSLYAAQYEASPGQWYDVLTGDPDSSLLFSGYKDLTLLFGLLRDYADTVVELARRYVMRGLPSDGDAALGLVAETHQRLLLDGQLLLSIVPEDQLPGPGHASGLSEAVSGWRGGLTRLSEVRDFIRGESNILGFAQDFMIFVQHFSGQSGDVFDSYDALYGWIQSDAASPLSYALAKYEEARDSYDSYRGYRDQLQAQFESSNEEYNARLFKIVGANPGTPEYDTPEQNEGSEIFLQRQSIQVALNRIKRNGVRTENLIKQIEYEIDRLGKVKGIQNAIKHIYIGYGNKQAALTYKIGDLRAQREAADVFARSLEAAIQTSWAWAGVGVVVGTANAYVQYQTGMQIADLEKRKEELAAAERAEVVEQEIQILEADSEAKIKTWWLQLAEIAVDDLEAQLLVAQETARLTALYNEKVDIERRVAESNASLADRYFADPVHLLRMQADMVEAEHAFQDAQKWVFFATRALEFKWNTAFVHQQGGQSWSLGSVFKLRNAEELLAMVAAMNDFNGLLEGSFPEEDYFDWFSVREDFLGYKLLDTDGQPASYADPETGALVGAIEAFRGRLTQLMDEDENIVLNFTTVRQIPGGTFFRGARLNPDGSCCLSHGTFLDKIEWIKIALPGAHSLGHSLLAGYLRYGGTAFLRNLDVGETDPDHPDRVTDEMTAYSTRYWFYDPDPANPGWRYNEGFNALVSMELTEDPRTPPSVPEINVFKERSVATTGWRLIVPTRDLGEPVLAIDELDDIELQFYHRAVARPEVSAKTQDADVPGCLETRPRTADCIRTLMRHSPRAAANRNGTER